MEINLEISLFKLHLLRLTIFLPAKVFFLDSFAVKAKA